MFGCSTVLVRFMYSTKPLTPPREGEDSLPCRCAGRLQLDPHAVVEERELAQALGQDVVVVFDVAEDLLRSAMKCTSVPRRSVVPDHLQRRHADRRCGTPSECAWPSRLIVSRSHSDSALTTETPTPCRPPEIL